MKQVDPSKYSFNYYKNIYGQSIFSQERKRFFSSHDCVYAEITELTKLTKKDYVVDFGCGDGNLSFLINSKFDCRVFGIDYSADAIEICKKKLENINNPEAKIDFINKDLKNLPALENIKTVFLCDVVEHLYDEEIEILFNQIKKWNNRNITVAIHTDNNLYLRYVRPVVNILYAISKFKSFQQQREEKKQEKELHVNLTNPFELKKKLKKIGFEQVILKYPTFQKKELINNQLGKLSKIPFLKQTCYLILEKFNFLHPTFYALYEKSEK